jgi:hypothetical protein
MTQSVTPAEYLAELQACLAMAEDISLHPQANAAFSRLLERLTAENPLAAQLTTLLWQDVIAARRSALFWEHLSEAERGMADQVMADQVQLKQNYLRLIQEQ